MVALQRKLGDELKRDLYRMELTCRAQKANEALQAFAMDIGETYIYEAFANGIRDPDIKLAVCLTQKTIFAESVVFALR